MCNLKYFALKNRNYFSLYINSQGSHFIINFPINGKCCRGEECVEILLLGCGGAPSAKLEQHVLRKVPYLGFLTITVPPPFQDRRLSEELHCLSSQEPAFPLEYDECGCRTLHHQFWEFA